MRPVFADPTTDFVFKRIFGAEAHKPLLVALLDHLLELEGERRILEIQHLSRDERVKVPELRLSIIDVMCTDAAGRRFVVKVQVLVVEGFEKQVVYDARKPYVMQPCSGEGGPPLCDVVGMTVCNFNLWPEQDEAGRFRVPMLSWWRMQELHSGEQELPRVQYAFLELPKYAAGDAPQTPTDRWAYFFREAKNLSVVPLALVEDPFRSALEIARKATFSSREDEAYERAKMAEQDARGALAVAYEEGYKSGLAEAHRFVLAKSKRDALLRLLSRTGLALTEDARARIAACKDVAALDRWFDNALAAKTLADVFS